MEYVALYRKYRPKTLEQVYGQKYIVDIFKNSIISNKFFHAYLLSGPRGTGKTTIAKLIAKIVNCEKLDGVNPCDNCNSCKLINDRSNPDIIEIDAASNNGVDEIRAIREKVVLMPSVSKYKVYIIDEVHMRSVSAFNALLKTLEEPPKHVIFILATTEIDKVPETIVSRCQCYDFKRISIDDIVSCLSYICECENVSVEEDVLKLIGDYCNGGMRDSIGLLDKLLTYSDNVDKKLFYDVVGLVDDDLIHDIFVNICEKNTNEVFDIIEKMVNSGKNLEIVVEQLLNLMKKLSVNGKYPISQGDFMNVLEGVSNILYNIKFASNQLLFFEIEILKTINLININNIENSNNDTLNIVNNENDDNDDEVQKNISTNSDVNKSDDSKDIIDNKQTFAKINFDPIINNAFALADKKIKVDIVNKWNNFNEYVHNKEFSSIVSYFLDSTIQVAGEKDVIISTDYESIVNNAASNITKLELLFNLVMGKHFNIAFVLTKEWNKLKTKYVNDLKSGKKYNYIEPKDQKDVIIEESADEIELPDVISSAKSVFGDDIVEVK